MAMKSTVLITGASKGIGYDLAERLLKDGYTVYCAARTMTSLEPLERLGGIPLRLDCEDRQSIDACVDRIAEDGGVDVLVNNAGYGLYGAIETTPLESGRAQMEVNFFAPVYLAQRLLPQMRERGGGRIINISSVAGRIYSPLSGWYCASKFALEGISDCMRLELEPFGIHVVLIEPGPIRTAWSDGAKNSLLENTEGTAYEAFGRQSLRLLRSATEGRMASDTRVVTKNILKAIQKKKPKARYLCGKAAYLSVVSRAFLGSTLFEKAMKGQLK